MDISKLVVSGKTVTPNRAGGGGVEPENSRLFEISCVCDRFTCCHLKNCNNVCNLKLLFSLCLHGLGGDAKRRKKISNDYF